MAENILYTCSHSAVSPEQKDRFSSNLKHKLSGVYSCCPHVESSFNCIFQVDFNYRSTAHYVTPIIGILQSFQLPNQTLHTRQKSMHV